MPPRPGCAPMWHARLLSYLPELCLTLLVRGYAQRYYLGEMRADGANSRVCPDGDTIEAFANATSATSTALTVGSSSFLAEYTNTPEFNPEALPENYMLLPDIETASNALM